MCVCVCVCWGYGVDRHFNNISAISWRSVLLVEVAGVPRENHWRAPSYWQALTPRYKLLQRWRGNFMFVTVVILVQKYIDANKHEGQFNFCCNFFQLETVCLWLKKLISSPNYPLIVHVKFGFVASEKNYLFILSKVVMSFGDDYLRFPTHIKNVAKHHKMILEWQSSWISLSTKKTQTLYRDIANVTT